MGKRASKAAQIIKDVLQLSMSKEELVEESQTKLQEMLPLLLWYQGEYLSTVYESTICLWP